MTDLAIFEMERHKLIRRHSKALHTIARYSDDAATIAALIDRIIVTRLHAEFHNDGAKRHE